MTSRPTSLSEQLTAARNAFNEGNYTSSLLITAQRIIKNNPRSCAAYLIAANTSLQLKDYVSAIYYAEHLLSVSPTMLKAYTLLTYAHYFNQNYEATLFIATQAINFGTKDASIFHLAAESCYLLSDLENACHLEKKAIELKPDYFDAYCTIARATFEQFDPIKNDDKTLLIAALNAANKALTIAEKKPCKTVSAYSIRAEIYLDLFEHEKAITDATTAIHLNDKDPINYRTRAMAYQCLNRHSEAIPDLDLAIDYSDEHSLALFIQRAESALALNQFQRVIDDSNYAAACGWPINFHVLLLVAKALYAIKEYDYVIANLAQAKNDPLFKGHLIAEELLINSYIARAKDCMTQKKWQTAIDDLTEALSIEPQTQEALQLRANCFRRSDLPLEAFVDERAHFYISKKVNVPSLRDIAKYFILKNPTICGDYSTLPTSIKETLIDCDITPETLNKEQELLGNNQFSFFTSTDSEEQERPRKKRRLSDASDICVLSTYLTK